jgi:hypothetical protein
MFVGSPLSGQEAWAPRGAWVAVVFHMDRANQANGRYSIQVQPNGTGAYWVGPPDFDLTEASGVQKITVSKATLEKIGAALPMVLGGACETHSKHLAQTGRKTLSFKFAGSSAECEFNYSDDQRLNQAETAFEAIGETMIDGQKLVHDQRFDRLGLDADMDSLIAEMKDGRAIEVQNLAPVLQSIAEDERVMDRVRRKAARLLQEIAAAPANAR